MKRTTRSRQDSTKEMTELAQRACLIAKDSAFNVRDYIENSSNIAYVAVKQCERELDDIEREIDEGLPAAITEVTEAEARQLLACLKFIIDLERIGDLLWSGAQHIQDLSSALPKEDVRVLLEMTGILLRMLEHIYKDSSLSMKNPRRPCYRRIPISTRRVMLFSGGICRAFLVSATATVSRFS